ncbi:hypothetical protein KMU_30800 [Proteus vulgaris]|nr:hypothetical protein KMU_30800 [Proteus vulgaris]
MSVAHDVKFKRLEWKLKYSYNVFKRYLEYNSIYHMFYNRQLNLLKEQFVILNLKR